MKVLDSPILPIAPEPNKRKVLIILVSLFGFVFTFLGLVVNELLDSRVKSAKRFSLLTGLKVGGVHVASGIDHSIDTPTLIAKGIKPVVEAILDARSKVGAPVPVVVQFFSNRQGEGRSEIINAVAMQLNNIGYSTLALSFAKEARQNANGSILPLKNAFDSRSYLDLVNTGASCPIVMVEVPAISVQIFNVSLFATANLSYFIADAGRKWTPADTFLLDDLKKHVQVNLDGILNKVHPDNMDDVLDEIPKERSWIRKFIKNKIVG